jgi:ABC-type uncharacterized transport system permease subunit
MIYSLSALAALVPATVFAMRRNVARDTMFWLLLAVALVGPTVWVLTQFSDTWRTGFSTSLWLTIAASIAVYALVALLGREAWRLTPLLLSYLFVLGVIATIWQQAPGKPIAGDAPAAWLDLHIAVSVLTYALFTVAAIAGFAVLLSERALKRKRPTALTRRLPSVADSEKLQVRLLTASEIVLALGLLSGMATLYLDSGTLFAVTHKSVFAVLAFLVIALLLVVHYYTGVRGRRAARFVLVAYLCLTLGYPGVKFVTDVLLA